MIIWGGHGILIPIAAVVGALAGGFCGGLLVKAGVSEFVMVPAVLWGAAVGVLFYAKTIGKTREVPLTPVGIGRTPEVIKKRHSFFFIPAFGWAVTLMVFAALASVFTLLAKPSLERGAELSKAEREENKHFEQADNLIMSSSKGIAHGNTEEAKALAKQFSTMMKAAREAGIEKGRTGVISLTDGEFLTYCQISEAGCAFLVHVPKVRKFADDAKEFIAQAAWVNANICVAQLNSPPQKLAVGIKGFALYDRVWVGVPSEDLEEDWEAGVMERHEGMGDRNALKVFFKEEKVEIESAEAVASPEIVEEETVEEVGVSDAVSEPEPEEQEDPSEPMVVEVEEIDKVDATLEALLPTEIRTWIAPDGREMEASLVRFLPSEILTAEFSRADGQVFEVTVDQLSPESQNELKALFEKVIARGVSE